MHYWHVRDADSAISIRKMGLHRRKQPSAPDLHTSHPLCTALFLACSPPHALALAPFSLMGTCPLAVSLVHQHPNLLLPRDFQVTKGSIRRTTNKPLYWFSGLSQSQELSPRLVISVGLHMCYEILSKILQHIENDTRNLLFPINCSEGIFT